MRPLVLAAAFAALATPALPQGGEVTVVMNLALSEDTSVRRALTSVRPILERIRGQPGLVSETLLMGSVDASQDYVHVMRWQSLEDWEALYEDQAFLDLLTEADPVFEPSIAEIYMSVPPAAQP